MKEIWKRIENFPDYMVSDQGNIKSFKYDKINGKILTPGKDKDGYLRINLYKNKKPHPKKIHRLVLENFEPIEDMDKFECNHKNGNKSYNIYPENIEWCIHSENIKHAYKIGLIIPMKGENNPMYGKQRSEETRKLIRENHADVKGENNPQSILTEKNVIEIRIDLNEGILTQKQIAEKFGVKQSTISKIKTRRIWKHI